MGEYRRLLMAFRDERRDEADRVGYPGSRGIPGRPLCPLSEHLGYRTWEMHSQRPGYWLSKESKVNRYFILSK
jgi:hypothetical protein